MAGKCTIIITTYNNPKLLKRLLNFYNKSYVKNKIIVADSSLEKNKAENKKNISTCSNLDIFYLDEFPTMDDFPVETGQFVKLRDTSAIVEDKYCLTCADDDFVIPNGINSSVEFLEKNPDYVIAQGQFYGFSVLPDSNNNPCFHWHKSRSIGTNNIDDPKERLISHMSKYYTTIYAVHRTEIMNLIWEETLGNRNLGIFGELTSSMLTSIYGKIKRLDDFYDIRELIPTSHGQNAKKLYDFVAEGTYDKKYLKLKNCLAMHLSKVAEISIKDAEKIVDKGWTGYTKRYNGFISSKISYMTKKMPLVSRYDDKAKELYKKMFRKKNISQAPIGSAEEPPAEYYDDFKLVEKYSIEHFKETEKEPEEELIIA